MKKISHLAKLLSIKYAQDMDSELTLLAPPSSYEEVSIPKAPNLPREFRDTNKPVPKMETMRSPQMDMPTEGEHVSVIKDLADQLRVGGDKFVALNPEQIQAILWIASKL